MKPQIHRHLLMSALLLLPTWAVAQEVTSSVPGTISYQGRVLDSSGNPVGTGTPVNRTVIFRIWDHPSNTQEYHLIYSEQQTVTIADGEFSVLLGQGATNGTQTFSYAETAKGPPSVSLPNAFNSSSRYLGVTVAAAATIALTDTEMFPRQQIVSSAFALRAKYAEQLGSNGTAAFTVLNSGDVGIGTTSPSAKLEVVGAIKANALQLPGAMISYDSDQTGILMFETPKCYFQDYVAIGNDINWSNTAPLFVSGTREGADMAVSYFNRSTGTAIAQSANTRRYPTIYCNGIMAAAEYYAFSDSRIKNVTGRSDGGQDLASLMGIEITDYSFKDTIEKGTGKYKKVIAQQVEQVFPQAVNLITEVIPDVYQKAGIKDGWVELKTDLKPGDRVRLISEKGDKSLHEVAEVMEGKFRPLQLPVGNEVFVYGREVDDFRSVDYEAIAMLNVSATQQVKREKDTEVKALLAENADLKARVAALETQAGRLSALESRDQAMTARFAALEKLLVAAGKADALPISLNTSTASEQ